MRRVPLLLLAYLAASLAGGVAFIAIVALRDGGGSPFFLAILPVFVAALGATVAAPVAVPTILATERWGKGPWWVFLLAGIACSALVIGLLEWFGSNGELWAWFALAAPSVASAMTFWFIAWYRNPPRQPVAPLAEVFE
ncbi:hypothetical protein [Erythrobacter sp.]|uniref:hypothetical protein n=1 Tax=Erythrobacter sp. TaxID=1042 RepID=UPI0014260086|nr:hypothetical protein [Erythrobacter sp.]QIQ85248.1 MAG: hypothetical protein G9473_00060 [Erythrobacter sp.]QIQ87999.1 MAG: hypothetical protein G9473_15825 [Erythrobacter sp.]